MPSPRPQDPAVARARTLARVLDRSYIDPIVGAILPGAGDLLTAGVGLYIVFVALSRRLSPLVIARMLTNLAVDAALGIVPIAGDIADLLYRANLRNLALLETRQPDEAARPVDWLVLALALAVTLAAIALPVMLVVWAIGAVVPG